MSEVVNKDVVNKKITLRVAEEFNRFLDWENSDIEDMSSPKVVLFTFPDRRSHFRSQHK